VVLVCGYIGAKEDFQSMLPLLAESGYRSYAYDHLGQFESDGPDDPAAYTVEHLAEDLGAVLAEVGAGVPVHAVGHCSGGFVVRLAATARPAVVRSVTLLGSGPSLHHSRRPPTETPPTLEDFLARGGAAALWVEMDKLWRRLRTLPPLWDTFERPPRERLLATKPAYLVGAAHSLVTYNRPVAELASTGIPTLVVHGVKDRHPWPIPVYRDMAGALGSELRTIDGVGHYPNVQQPAATCRILVEFWSRLERGGITRTDLHR
jgi:pimeloyl-ACP methyl ester carboxylesterase